jgi:hypothetical protein
MAETLLEMPDGRQVRAFVSGSGTAELVTMRHEMPDGSQATSQLWRPVPPPAPAAPPPTLAPSTRDENQAPPRFTADDFRSPHLRPASGEI